MSRRFIQICLLLVVLAIAAAAAHAQLPNPYGASIDIANAKKVAASAVAEAKKLNLNMAVAVVDTAGNLVYFEKMDGTQIGSVKDRKSTRLNSSHTVISYAVFCLKKKKKINIIANRTKE